MGGRREQASQPPDATVAGVTAFAEVAGASAVRACHSQQAVAVCHSIDRYPRRGDQHMLELVKSSTKVNGDHSAVVVFVSSCPLLTKAKAKNVTRRSCAGAGSGVSTDKSDRPGAGSDHQANLRILFRTQSACHDIRSHNSSPALGVPSSCKFLGFFGPDTEVASSDPSSPPVPRSGCHIWPRFVDDHSALPMTPSGHWRASLRWRCWLRAQGSSRRPGTGAARPCAF